MMKINLYARVAKGYRAPSIQGRALFAFTNGSGRDQHGRSETILSFEGGVKANLKTFALQPVGVQI